MTYAFTFDASACTGCKACQVACKDKNDLPLGVLWRRVYEISGGAWTNVGGDVLGTDVWQSTVFAYNLSLACNHCVHPKCAGVCPTDAYIVRQDGIVIIDGKKCIGCGYCAWACPYSAPRFDPDLHQMSKCDLCYDRIDAGLAPACVAACPMRVLDIVTVERLPDDLAAQIKLWDLPGTDHPFPLPTFSRTEPHLLLKKHAAMDSGLEKMISNAEEVHPPHAKSKHIPDEIPLVIFTLSAQAAAGIAFFACVFGLQDPSILTTIGLLLAIGGLSSFFHLGKPFNAWRSLGHLKKSWLSREILMLLVFSLGWLLAWVRPVLGSYFLAFAGVGLVHSMTQVYRLRSVPSWNTLHTQFKFYLSATLLGGLIFLLMALRSGLLQNQELRLASLILSLGMAFRIAVAGRLLNSPRTGSHILGYFLALACLLFIIPSNFLKAWSFIPVLFFVLLAEMADRWLFFKGRHPIL